MSLKGVCIWIGLMGVGGAPLWAGSIAVPDSSFENVDLQGGAFQYSNGVVSPFWVFTGTTGVDASSNTWFVPPPPDGTNAAFLQSANTGGSISQSIDGFTIGDTYQVTYYEALRPGGYPAMPVDVSLGGVDLGTFSPASTDFVAVTTGSMTANATSMMLQFQTTTIADDLDTAIDLVTIQGTGPSGAPEPASVLLVGGAMAMVAVARRKLSARR